MLYASRNRHRGWLRRHRERMVGTSVLLFLFVLTVILQIAESGRWQYRDQLRVWFFDVGQGDAIFFETPEGYQVLVDGGPDRAVLSKLGAVMWPWDRTIDAVVLTHPDQDHVAGLVHVLQRYRVQDVYWTGAEHHTFAAEAFEREMKARVTRVHQIKRGDAWRADDLKFETIFPFDAPPDGFLKEQNRYSLVLRATYGDTSVLLTGDTTAQEEDQYAALSGDVDVLKVAHHGSRTSTQIRFLETTYPETAVISVGEDNTYGHPHPIVLQRLSESKSR